MSTKYSFTLGTKPCDICEPMAGTYPYPPNVPVHTNCDCTVTPNSPNDNCQTELRNFESQEVKYSDTYIYTADAFNDSTSDSEESIPVDMAVLNEFWEVPELRDKCNWNPPGGQKDAKFTVPAESAGEVTIYVEAEITQVICKAEEWEVCRRAPAPGSSTGHTYEERKLRIVGGGATALTDILNTEMVHDGAEDPGYEDDDEVPV